MPVLGLALNVSNHFMKTIIYILILFLSTKFCTGQDGFRKDLPLSQLLLDTPQIFEHYKDFQIINYNSKDSLKKLYIFSFQVNSSGKIINSFTTFSDGSQNVKIITKHDSTNKIIEKVSYPDKVNYPEKGGSIEKRLYTYNEKQQLVKQEIFSNENLKVLKHEIIDTVHKKCVKYFRKVNLDSLHNLNVEKLDSNYEYRNIWSQNHLFTYKYDESGKLVELTGTDEINQKNRTVYVYDKYNRIKKVLEYHNQVDISYKCFKDLGEYLKTIYNYRYFHHGYKIVPKMMDGSWNTNYSYKIFMLNENGKIIETIEKWVDRRDKKHKTNDLIERTEFYYDKFGRIFMNKKFNSWDNFVDITQFKYKDNTIVDIEDDLELY
jgi:hypothetical protein